MRSWIETEYDLEPEIGDEEFEGELSLELLDDSEAEFDDEFDSETGGSRGREHVKWVQRSLNQILGLRLTVDGVNGPKTRSAVRMFQSRRGLTVDGIVGPRTEAAIRQALGSPAGGRGLVLDRFDFDRDRILPHHQPILARAAAQILAQLSGSASRVTVTLTGHTDPVGSDAYNLSLGKRRAEVVRRALIQAIDRRRRGSSRRVTFRVLSRGEQQPIPGDPSRSRRVEIVIPRKPSQPRPDDDEHNSCGVPARALRNETAMELEIGELETSTRRRRVTVRPRLSLFQNHSTRSHRNHFECGALRQARRIAALGSPTASNCRRRVGATSYDSGADIIRAIRNAHGCLGSRRLDTIHVFSHGFSGGIPGTTTGSAGLYQNTRSGVDTADGGRRVRDLPAGLLSDNVTIVLHGCNMAAGTDNIARSLFDHLNATLRNPRVFGHHNAGCGGRNNSWREYSTRHPTGRNLRTLPNIASTGCCGP